MVHVVTFGDLGRTAVTAAVMGDDAISIGEEVQHLCVPIVGRQRPTVVEHDRLRVLRTPVLVEDLNAVLGGYSAHAFASFSGVLRGCSVGCNAESGWNCKGRGGGSSSDEGSAACKREEVIGHFGSGFPSGVVRATGV